MIQGAAVLSGTMSPAGPAGPAAWMGYMTWAAEVNYLVGPPASTVVYNNGFYVCTSAHLSGALFDASKWQLITQGPTGPASWSQAAAWGAGEPYVVGPPASLVKYNNSVYVCTTSHTSGSTFDASKWFLLIAGFGAQSAPAHQFMTGYDGAGTFTSAQPQFTDIGGTATASQLPATISGPVATPGTSGNTLQSNGSAWVSLPPSPGVGGVRYDIAQSLTAANQNQAQTNIGLLLRGFIAGLTLSNDATTPNAVIDVSAGQATSDDQSTLMNTSALTKSVSAWAVGSGNGGLDTGSVLASTWYHVYLIERTDTGVVDALLSQAPNLSASVTCTSASPGVFTWNGGAALPFQNGCPISLSGTAPTGLTTGTIYYVVSANRASGTFSLAATQGGAAINTTSTGSGLTASAAPIMPANYTKKRRIGSIRTDSSSHIVGFKQNGDRFIYNTTVTDATAAALSASASNIILTVPPGVVVNATFMAAFSDGSGANSYGFALNQGQVPPAYDGSGSYAVFCALLVSGSGSGDGASIFTLATDTAARITFAARLSTTTVTVGTMGYEDSRGRFA